MSEDIKTALLLFFALLSGWLSYDIFRQPKDNEYLRGYSDGVKDGVKGLLLEQRHLHVEEGQACFREMIAHGATPEYAKSSCGEE